jgi:transcriptional regulator
MLQAIVGIELPIARLEGKWKVSQDRPDEDRAGVVAGLGAGEPMQRAMAELVRERMPSTSGT